MGIKTGGTSTKDELISKRSMESGQNLQEELTGHHTKPTKMGFRMPSGKISSTDKEHLSILVPHLVRVFNTKKSIDWLVLNKIR